jgi:hypothetical protein
VGVQVATYFANPSKEMDPYILIKPILVMAAMYLYNPLVGLLLDKPVTLITDITEQAAIEISNTDSTETFEKFFLDQLTSMKSGTDTWDILSWNPILEILHILVSILALTVSLYIMIRQVFLIGVYYILGIFVLPFSLIPSNQEILKRWFFGFLAVFLWIPILRILQTIIILVDVQAFNENGGDEVSALASLVLQVCGVFFILMTPKFANMLVSGSGDSDGNGWLMFIGREFYYRRLGGLGGGIKNRMMGK